MRIIRQKVFFAAPAALTGAMNTVKNTAMNAGNWMKANPGKAALGAAAIGGTALAAKAVKNRLSKNKEENQ